MNAIPHTEPDWPIVRATSGGRVAELDVSCRCGQPLTLVRHGDAYRVIRRLGVTPRSPFGLGMASLTCCPNRNCRQPFPELIDPDRVTDLFER